VAEVREMVYLQLQVVVLEVVVAVEEHFLELIMLLLDVVLKVVLVQLC
jgi:hypothetical protein